MEERPRDHGQRMDWSAASKRCGSMGVGPRLPSLNGSSGPTRSANSKRICDSWRICSHAPNHSAPPTFEARVGGGVYGGLFLAKQIGRRSSGRRADQTKFVQPGQTRTPEPQSSLLTLCSPKSSGCMGSFVIRGGSVAQNCSRARQTGHGRTSRYVTDLSISHGRYPLADSA